MKLFTGQNVVFTIGKQVLPQFCLKNLNYLRLLQIFAQFLCRMLTFFQNLITGMIFGIYLGH